MAVARFEIKGIVIQLTEMSENSEQQGQKGKIEVRYRINQIREFEFNLIDMHRQFVIGIIKFLQKKGDSLKVKKLGYSGSYKKGVDSSGRDHAGGKNGQDLVTNLMKVNP